MNPVLQSWNEANAKSALDDLLACCGSRRWAHAMVAQRPFCTVDELRAAVDQVWRTMEEPDWMEAFACHPRIGEQKADRASKQSVAWSRQEQASAANAAGRVLSELAAGNQLYEQRFGFTYIICATGKSAEEMQATLNCRLSRDRDSELREAAEQQRQITQIRIGKWLAE